MLKTSGKGKLYKEVIAKTPGGEISYHACSAVLVGVMPVCG